MDIESIKRDLRAEVRPGKVIRFALIPQFKGTLTPMKEVFGLFVTTIGLLFVQAKLIEKDHPAITGAQRGPGAIVSMVADAATRLEFRRENLRQITIFYAIVGMLVFGVLGLITFILHFATGHAHAQAPGASYFNDSGTANTWINDLFPYNNTTTAANGIPATIGAVLLIYNTALLALASVLAIWSLMSIVIDSAHHGKMGGNRHSMLYGPIRIVAAIGLLVPISNGYNSAQILTINMAHMGSGLATTVWTGFQTSLFQLSANAALTPGGDLNPFVHELYEIGTCVADVKQYDNTAAMGNPQANTSLQTNPNSNGFTTTTGGPATTSVIGSYTIRFGTSSEPDLCGSMTIPAVNSALMSAGDSQDYVNIVTQFYTNTIVPAATLVAQQANPSATQYTSQTPAAFATTTFDNVVASLQGSSTSGTNTLDGEAAALAQTYSSNYGNITNATGTGAAASDGWVDAGAVFMRMAKIAANVAQVQTRNLSTQPPNSNLLPQGFWGNTAHNIGCTFSNSYTCSGSNAAETQKAIGMMNQQLQTAETTAGVPKMDSSGREESSATGADALTKKIVSETHLNELSAFFANFGSNVATTSNPGGHAFGVSFAQPFVDMLNFGNVLAIMDAGLFAGAALLGAQVAGTGDVGIPIVLTTFGSFFFPLAMMFSVGIPLLPALRFLFGILTWLMTIFEALVCLPVVALWHVNSEGEGLFAHGKQGYLMILQMMLRPVLMVFGLIGAIVIFDVLYDFVSYTVIGTFWNTLQLSAFGALSEIIPFFGFLFGYCFLVYSVANVSFNLINLIPDHVLAWIGSNIAMSTQGDGGDGALSQTQSSMGSLASGVTGAYLKRGEFERANPRGGAIESDDGNKGLPSPPSTPSTNTTSANLPGGGSDSTTSTQPSPPPRGTAALLGASGTYSQSPNAGFFFNNAAQSGRPVVSGGPSSSNSDTTAANMPGGNRQDPPPVSEIGPRSALSESISRALGAMDGSNVDQSSDGSILGLNNNIPNQSDGATIRRAGGVETYGGDGSMLGLNKKPSPTEKT